MSAIKLSRLRGDIWKQQCVFHYTYSFSYIELKTIEVIWRNTEL